VRRILVLGAGNQLVGVISLADLATRLTPVQPEVVEAIEESVSGALALKS